MSNRACNRCVLERMKKETKECGGHLLIKRAKGGGIGIWRVPKNVKHKEIKGTDPDVWLMSLPDKCACYDD